uniref:Protein kinase domain-containing protein n=1 Tax=Trieres chinensis TaxID=1514140 RepID=A0A7S2EFN2_TRICV|mmetsp:Transcript_21725/g.43956  ORF Transcript_21725/g.43956 Transcript_21725/m.43956 type:complete len:354 (+) Transcript_21725:32-1093(+)
MIESRPRSEGDAELEYIAYWPQRRLQDAIYGSVWACLVLRRHHGVAADDAARAAGVEPGSRQAPIVWEIVGTHVAIKMVEWSRVQHTRGRLLEDPVKEIAAMQLLGNGDPHVLGSTEVLQDDDFLYSIMPYCRSGDLFGIVVSYAEDNGGEGGMSEPVARYWFRQILKGLHYLQTRGVCHRDLSLENILVDEENCLVIDMGMCLRVPYNCPMNSGSVVDVTAGTMRRLIKPQGVCGKQNYMSPEIYRNTDDFDGFAIDLWAAGVILYIMLTGFPPYDQASLADQRFEVIVTGNLVEQLQNWDIYLTEDAGNLMQSMLQLDPRDRLTLAQVMNHPWVVHGEVEVPPPRTDALPH